MKIKNHNDFGGGDRGFCKGIREGANVMLVITAFALSSLSYGMPSEQELKEVKPLVDSLIADDIQAMKAKKKSPKDVAVALAAFSDKAESEAGKFLLLRKAFCVSARGNIDDYAAHVLNRIRNEIADVSAEYIVDLVSKEIRNISAVKSPKVFAIYSEAKRTVDLRRRLATIVSRLRKEPDDKALLRQQAEILAALGNWTRALEVYAKIGTKAAQYELDPQSVEEYDVFSAADFWWNYKATDDAPFKAHAATLYHAALDKNIATGLRREMALKRIKETEMMLADVKCGIGSRVSKPDKTSVTSYSSSSASSAKYYGVELVGSSVKESKGILGGFANKSYAKINAPFNPKDKTIEVVIEFKTIAKVDDAAGVLSAAPKCGFTPLLINDGRLVGCLSSNGASWDIAFKEQIGLNLLPNTTYRIKVTWDGKSYSWHRWENGSWRKVKEVACAIAIFGGSDLQFGVDRLLGYPFSGAIDLSRCYISIDGSLWWEGLKGAYRNANQ